MHNKIWTLTPVGPLKCSPSWPQSEQRLPLLVFLSFKLTSSPIASKKPFSDFSSFHWFFFPPWIWYPEVLPYSPFHLCHSGLPNSVRSNELLKGYFALNPVPHLSLGGRRISSKQPFFQSTPASQNVSKSVLNFTSRNWVVLAYQPQVLMMGMSFHVEITVSSCYFFWFSKAAVPIGIYFGSGRK